MQKWRTESDSRRRRSDQVHPGQPPKTPKAGPTARCHKQNKNRAPRRVASRHMRVRRFPTCETTLIAAESFDCRPRDRSAESRSAPAITTLGRLYFSIALPDAHRRHEGLHRPTRVRFPSDHFMSLSRCGASACLTSPRSGGCITHRLMVLADRLHPDTHKHIAKRSIVQRKSRYIDDDLLPVGRANRPQSARIRPLWIICLTPSHRAPFAHQ